MLTTCLKSQSAIDPLVTMPYNFMAGYEHKLKCADSVTTVIFGKTLMVFFEPGSAKLKKLNVTKLIFFDNFLRCAFFRKSGFAKYIFFIQTTNTNFRKRINGNCIYVIWKIPAADGTQKHRQSPEKSVRHNLGVFLEIADLVRLCRASD